MLDESENIVFFGGAGVSTESGIPDFRSVDGLYNQKYDYPPETILSHDFFVNKTEEFYKFYREKMLIDSCEPNNAHRALVKLEKMGKLKCVVTQNIDGLHQMAGSKTVYELHGTIWKNTCMKCGRHYDLSYVKNQPDVPRCNCGGVIKPDVVLYGEMLDDECVSKAVSAIRKADMLIVAGTSLSVYPAAGFINYYRGDKLVLINKSETPYDSMANLVIHDSVGKVLGEAANELAFP